MAEQGKITAQDLISSDVVKEVQNLDKALAELLTTIADVAKNAAVLADSFKQTTATQEETSKKAQAVNDNFKELTDVEKEIIKIEQQRQKIINQTAAQMSEEGKKLEEAKQKRNENNKNLKEEIKLRDAEAKSIDKLIAENKKLLSERNKINTSTKEGRARIAELNAQIDANTETIRSNSDAAGKQRMNIGNYASALEALQGPLGNVINGTKALGKQFLSLLTNPIVAMIAAIAFALQQLYTAFKKTDSGATELDARLKQLQAALDVYFSRIVKMVDVHMDLAKAFKSLFSGEFKEAWENVKKAGSDWIGIFKGVGDQLKNATKAAYDYAYALDVIEDSENNYISKRAENLNKIAKLEAEAADRTKTIKQRRAALEEAMRLGEEEVKTEKKFIDQRLQAELNMLAAKSETAKKVTAEQIRQFITMSDEEQANASESLKIVRNNNEDKFKEIEQLYAKSIEVETKYFEENKRNIAKLSQFELEILMQRLKNEEGFIEAKLIKSKENSQEELNNTILLLNKKREIELANINLTEGEKVKITADYNKQIEEATLKRSEYIKKQSLLEVESRILAQEKGSVAELEMQRVLLMEKYLADISNTKATEEEKKKIIAQYVRDLQTNSEAVAAKQVALLEQQLSRETQAIAEQYMAREINEDQFAKRLLDAQIAMVEKELEIANLSTEQKIALQEKLTNFKLQKFNEEKQAQEQLINESVELANGLFDLGSALRERETAELEAEKEYRLSLVGDDAKERERIEKEYQAKANQIKRRQAISDKISALFQVALNTAMGITNALSKVITAPLAPVIAAAGAVQAAVIAAKPIPKFAKGVTDFDGGLAEVGEAGREMIELPSGKTFLTPDKATKMLLPKGSNVYTHNETEEMLRNGVSVEKFDELIKEQKETRKALSNKIENHTTITQGGFEYGIRKGGTKIKLIDKYFRG